MCDALAAFLAAMVASVQSRDDRRHQHHRRFNHDRNFHDSSNKHRPLTPCYRRASTAHCALSAVLRTRARAVGSLVRLFPYMYPARLVSPGVVGTIAGWAAKLISI